MNASETKPANSNLQLQVSPANKHDLLQHPLFQESKQTPIDEEKKELVIETHLLLKNIKG